MLHIQPKPYFATPGSDDALSLRRAGDTLIINDDELDLSVIPEGAIVQNASALHPYLRDQITRTGGRVHIAVRLPVHWRSGHISDPPAIIDPPDGPIALPDLSGEPPEEAEEAEHGED